LHVEKTVSLLAVICPGASILGRIVFEKADDMQKPVPGKMPPGISVLFTRVTFVGLAE
jgi:hypothetical protein